MIALADHVRACAWDLTLEAGACRAERAANGRDQSMTSSARTKMASDRESPRSRATRWFTTSPKTVGCSTGSSAGLAPLRIRSTYVAARRYILGKLGP